MPNIPLLEPTVLRGVVQQLPLPENLVLSNLLPRADYPFNVVTWDILRGSRTVGKPNVPNAEAHIVPRLGRAQGTAAMIYYREKKVFQPTTTEWIRRVGTIGTLQSAEEAILRELQDLNVRCDNFVEYGCWQAMKGSWSASYPDVQINLDYGFKSSHKPHPANNWAATGTTGNQIIDDITAWQLVVQRDARVTPTDVFTSSKVLTYIFDAFARQGNGTMLSDTMKDQYYRTGVLPGFLGLNWHKVEGQYVDDTGTVNQFVPDNALYLASLTNYAGTAPFEILSGPSADFESPANYIGKFTKSWNEPDPSGRQVLLEYMFLPVIYLPDNFLYVADVTSTT